MLRMYLKGRVLFVCVLFCFVFSSVSAELMYALEFRYEAGSLSLVSSDVLYSRFPAVNIDLSDDDIPSYSLEVLDDSGAVIYTEIVYVPLLGVRHTGLPNGTIIDGEFFYDDTASFTIFVPYYESGNSIVLLDESGNSVLETSTSVFAHTRSESSVSSSGSSFQQSSEGSSSLALFVLVLVVLCVVVSYVVYRYARKKK